MWEYTVTDTNLASTVISYFYVTSSILPPSFTITDNPNPETSPDVDNPPVTRIITPPPYPYTFTTPESNKASRTTTTNAAAAVFPIVTYKPGKAGPICKSGCGKPCLLFCSHPCLLDCTDGGDDFPDPINPNPPKRPTPPVQDDPLPTGKPGPDTPPPDPNEDDPEDPDEEDEDAECAAEFNLAAPAYDGTVGRSPAPTSTVSIAPPPSPPTPSPPPNPSPPSPNPATESLHCYTETGRGDAIKALNDFCNDFQGTVLDATSPKSPRTLSGQYGADCAGALGCFVNIYLSVTVTNGCRFTVDGGDPNQDCGRIIRETIDECDRSSTRFKQGGTVTSNCAIWDFDPNVNWG